MNYENVGGTPVLGVTKPPVIIGHLASRSARAIKSMILSTEQCIKGWTLPIKLQHAVQKLITQFRRES